MIGESWAMMMMITTARTEADDRGSSGLIVSTTARVRMISP